MHRTPILLLLLLTTGCTAAKANFQLVAAEQAIIRARQYGAEEQAEYEYTMALRYLEKAREEAGYSEFRIADALARQSAEWSDRAVIFMERRGKADIDLSDFNNAPDPQPEGEGEGEDPEAELVPPPPIPGEQPEGEDADDVLEELFGEEVGPATDDEAPEEEAPKPEDFDMDDDIEIDE